MVVASSINMRLQRACSVLSCSFSRAEYLSTVQPYNHSHSQTILLHNITVSAIKWSLYWSVALMRDCSKKANLCLPVDSYVPTLTCGHPLWVEIGRSLVQVKFSLRNCLSEKGWEVLSQGRNSERRTLWQEPVELVRATG